MIRRQRIMVKGAPRRSKPFTELQRQTFVGILKDYRNVISNKSSTEQSVLDKKRAWKEITRIFNANQLTAEERTSDQLKKLWMNMKQLRRASDRTLSAMGESSSTELIPLSPTEKLFSSDMMPKEMNATEEHGISIVGVPEPAEIAPTPTQILPTPPSTVSLSRLAVPPPLSLSPSTPVPSLTPPVAAPRRKSCSESNIDKDLEKQRLMNQIEFDTILFNERLERERELHEMEKEERRVKLEEAKIKLEHTKRMCELEYNKKRRE